MLRDGFCAKQCPARIPAWAGSGGVVDRRKRRIRKGGRDPDVRRFVATLEEWIIRTLAVFCVVGERREDRVGVWVRRPQLGAEREDKIAAIGVRIRRWITMHGAAINLDCDLSHYAGIVPCGVSEPRYGVTSLADLGIAVDRDAFDAVLLREFAQLFGPVAAAAR